MSVVLGVDPSLTITGCALVRWDEGTDFDGPYWETWRARSPKPEVVTIETTRRRIRTMLREILALVPPRLSLSVVEGPSRGSTNGLADERAGLRWMLIDQLMSRGPVAVLAPTTRAIIAADHGHAPKEQVVKVMRSLVPEAHIPDHNVGDAVALARAGARQLGFFTPYTDKQVLAHAKVAWPVENERELVGMGKN